ncbi:glutaredoxin [Tulasnella sp. 403]|nr:glutaredoxin [Tulasnella sp. 403]
MAVKDTVETAISTHKVAIFSKSYCPFCKRAKSLIASYNLPAEDVKILELDEEADGPEIQAYLQQKTEQRTVPNIFINQEHIGGSDDLAAAEASGKLKQLIAQAEASV